MSEAADRKVAGRRPYPFWRHFRQSRLDARGIVGVEVKLGAGGRATALPYSIYVYPGCWSKFLNGDHICSVCYSFKSERKERK